jgi:hypothetical protein
MFGNKRLKSQNLVFTVYPCLFKEELPGTIHFFFPCSVPPFLVSFSSIPPLLSVFKHSTVND